MRGLAPSAEFSTIVKDQMLALSQKGTVPREITLGGISDDERVRYSFYKDTQTSAVSTEYYSTTVDHDLLVLEEERSWRVDPASEPLDTRFGAVSEEMLAPYERVRFLETWKYCISLEKGARLGRTIKTGIYGQRGPSSQPTELVILPMDKQPAHDMLSLRSFFGYSSGDNPRWGHNRVERAKRTYKAHREGPQLLARAQEQLDLEHLIPAFRAFGMEPSPLLSWVEAAAPDVQ